VAFLSNMPATTVPGIAIAVVQHLAPDIGYRGIGPAGGQSFGHFHGGSTVSRPFGFRPLK
jgi:hypothetical protein